MIYSIIGPGGYIGQRHIDAIHHSNGKIISYLDLKKCDSLNNDINFFSNEDMFFEHLKESKPDFCVVCSPNYLHSNHIISILQSGINVISEKPNCISIEEFLMIEKKIEETNLEVHTIMQLRLHPVIKKLKAISTDTKSRKKAKISFITPRDSEYLESWKTKKEFSGGILFNLGVHYFDLLIQAFGEALKSEVFYNEDYKAKGQTTFKNLDVEWYFSIDPDDQKNGMAVERLFEIDNEKIEFSKVPNDLHYENYVEILKGSNMFSFKEIASTMNFMFSINE